jgi:hypothetical protein
MSDFQASGQSGTRMNKNVNTGTSPIPEPVRYRKKGTQSGTGMLWYRTEIQDAGMHIAFAIEIFFFPSAVDGAVRDIEEAPYTVLAEHEGWEEREFPATKWVSTEASDSSPHDGPEHRKVIRLLFFIKVI